MGEPPGITTIQPNTRQVLSAVETVGIGQQGFVIKALQVDQAQVGHNFYVSINVQQLPNRVDDVQFYLLDAPNYAAWTRGLPSGALVRIPRIIAGTSLFVPSVPGPYYIILDNRHSTFTQKTVALAVTEFWLAQVEVKAPLPPPPEPAPAGKVSWLERLTGWFRRFPLFAAVVLFLAVESMVVLFGLAVIIASAGVSQFRLGDPWPFMAALVIGGVVLFGIFFVAVTGRSIPIAPGSF